MKEGLNPRRDRPREGLGAASKAQGRSILPVAVQSGASWVEERQYITTNGTRSLLPYLHLECRETLLQLRQLRPRPSTSCTDAHRESPSSRGGWLLMMKLIHHRLSRAASVTRSWKLSTS